MFELAPNGTNLTELEIWAHLIWGDRLRICVLPQLETFSAVLEGGVCRIIQWLGFSLIATYV